MTPWGPTGELVYRRSYRRLQPDGEYEDRPDTVRRVVDGNLRLVPLRYHEPDERGQLERLFLDFAALPAGRHLWISGVTGRQFLFNCHARVGMRKIPLPTSPSFSISSCREGE